MRMDEIGWHSVHGADFINEREHGAGDWVFLLIKSPCRIFADGEMRQFPAYTWILYTPDACQKYGADGAEYYDDWMHFAPDAEEEALLRALWDRPTHNGMMNPVETALPPRSVNVEGGVCTIDFPDRSFPPSTPRSQTPAWL